MDKEGRIEDNAHDHIESVTGPTGTDQSERSRQDPGEDDEKQRFEIF